MPKQTITWTVLPDGQLTTFNSDGHPVRQLRFSAHISPRLVTDGPDGTLADFPDWTAGPSEFGRSWPDTLAPLSYTLLFPDLGVELPAVQRLATPPPDPERWAALFRSGTFVRGHQYRGMDHKKVHSFPVTSILEFLADRYGRFGAMSPRDFPAYDDIISDGAFGPLGFEGITRPGLPGDGPTRRARLRQELADRFDTGPGSGPETWAIPFDPDSNATPDGIASNFLQLEQFLQRGLQVRNDPGPFLPRLDVPQIDFHEMVALVQNHPLLQRLLGLAIDLITDDTSSMLDPDTVFRSPAVLRVDGFQPVLPDTAHVFPRTSCLVGENRFLYGAADPNDTDLALRHLKLGDPTRFRLIRVDPAGNAVKTMQFAANVSHTHINGTKVTSVTPEEHALPALRGGGFAVARPGRASQLTAHFANSATLNATAFTPDNDATGEPVDVFAEDIIRGYRWDVLDEADGRWRSLMWQAGEYHLLNQAEAGRIAVVEEAAAVSAVSTATTDANDPGDLYAQETLVHWNGWSLAVPRLGEVAPTGDDLDADNPATEFKMTTSFAVPREEDKRLPRLRFGRSYRLRARAVDLAGNSLPPDDAATDGVLVSPLLPHQRYEPVTAPRVVLHQPHTAGESNEVVVIRSENRNDRNPSTVFRFIVPPRTAQVTAEQHGMFDLGGPGHPIDQGAYERIAMLDAGSLENHPAATPEDEPAGSHYYPVRHLPLNYLPDVLARQAVVRQLPERGPNGPTRAEVPFADDPAAWPNVRSIRLRLTGGAPNWQIEDVVENDVEIRQLHVALAKGDRFQTLVSCKFNENDIGVLGLWPWIQQWAARQNPPVDPSGALTAIVAGEHWMFTPWRQVELVHAVRTPLRNPRLERFNVLKPFIGATFARFPESLCIMSRKSTAQVDVVGEWRMPVDDRRNSDPVTPQDFKAHAFTLPIDRNAIPDKDPDFEEFDKRHEFGDTKFRRVRYTAVATSSFAEFFREAPLRLEVSADPFTVGVPFEATTVKMTGLVDGVEVPLQPAPPGTAANARPAPGDYVLDEAANTVQALQFGRLGPVIAADGSARVTFSYVRPDIHATGPVAPRVIPNSARPAAPKVLYVLPTFMWGRTATQATRLSGGLRVYLDRPWWSSGDEERLGVVCWRRPAGAIDPSSKLAPYVTQWGFDPVYDSASSNRLPTSPKPNCFPLSTHDGGPLSLAEVGDRTVDVAGHGVQFDAERGLWFCDIHVTEPDGTPLKAYFPFIRLALARYQPSSLDDCHLSKVVLADFAQLTPDRFLSVTPSPRGDGYRWVTLSGRGYTATDGPFPKTSRVTVHVEQRDPSIADDALAWTRAGGFNPNTALLPSVSDGNLITWTNSEVGLPSQNDNELRLVVEEFEEFEDDAVEGFQERLVYRDTFPLGVVDIPFS